MIIYIGLARTIYKSVMTSVITMFYIPYSDHNRIYIRCIYGIYTLCLAGILSNVRPYIVQIHGTYI